MTREDKELLKKDLCARLPYKVMGHVHTEDRADIIAPIVSISPSGKSVLVQDNAFAWFATLEQTKPYLRSMSSMTDEEEGRYNLCQAMAHSISEEHWTANDGNVWKYSDAIDYLNAHHFDYRGLIAKGLALEAPEGMYKF